MEFVEEKESRIAVRGLRPADLEPVIRLDAKSVGHRRDEYFKVKLEQNLSETGIKISLAAEHDGCFCGFLLARVYYGEFGTPELTASLDTLGVDPAFQGQGVGTALIDQLCKNLEGLQVTRLETVVGWDNQRLLHFFHSRNFRPAERICLDLKLE